MVPLPPLGKAKASTNLINSGLIHKEVFKTVRCTSAFPSRGRGTIGVSPMVDEVFQTQGYPKALHTGGGAGRAARNCDLVQHVTGDFGNLLAKGLLFLHSKTEAMPRCKPFLLAGEQVNQAAFSRREISIYSPQANLGVRNTPRGGGCCYLPSLLSRR